MWKYHKLHNTAPQEMGQTNHNYKTSFHVGGKDYIINIIAHLLWKLLSYNIKAQVPFW